LAASSSSPAGFSGSNALVACSALISLSTADRSSDCYAVDRLIEQRLDLGGDGRDVHWSELSSNGLRKLFSYKPLRTNCSARIARRLQITPGTRTRVVRDGPGHSQIQIWTVELSLIGTFLPAKLQRVRNDPHQAPGPPPSGFLGKSLHNRGWEGINERQHRDQPEQDN
jgi:hypothetical protein